MSKDKRELRILPWGYYKLNMEEHTMGYISVKAQLPPRTHVTSTWRESGRVLVLVDDDRGCYEAFAILIEHFDGEKLWYIDGHSGNWNDKVLGWAYLPARRVDKA